MPKASEVASELRKLADSLDREPDATIRNPWIMFYCDERDEFLNTARLLPRPLTKRDGIDGKNYELVYGDILGPVHVECCVPKSKACRLVKPAQEAVYECLPILSADEEAALETAVAE